MVMELLLRAALQAQFAKPDAATAKKLAQASQASPEGKTPALADFVAGSVLAAPTFATPGYVNNAVGQGLYPYLSAIRDAKRDQAEISDLPVPLQDQVMLP